MSLPSFQTLLRNKSSQTFLVFYHHADKNLEINFKDFRDQTLHLAHILYHSHAVREGHKVALIVGNTFETYLSYAAILYLGAVLVPLNPQDTPEYWQGISDHAQVALTVVTKELASSAQSLSTPHFILDLETLKNEITPILPEISTDPFFLQAALFYTSGTTGSPKGVLLSWGNLLTNLEGTRRVTGLNVDSTLMSCLPLYHVNAFNFAFLLPLFLGCKVVYQAPFFQPAFWKIAREEKVEAISLVPTVIRALSQEQRQIDTGTVRFIISAASPLDRDLFKTFTEKFKIRITQAYGLSETVNFSLFTPPDLKSETYNRVTLSESTPSAGAAVWGNEIFLANENGELIQEPGVTGEVLIRGKNVFSGYFHNAEATKLAFHKDLFRTGDLGYYRDIDGQRFYFLQGRSKEIIKRNGEIIYLSEIDAALRKFGLIEACAVGFKNQFTGEEVGLYVSTGDFPKAEQTLAQVKTLLGFSRSPKVIVHGKEFPQTSVGKIKRKSLEPLFAGYENLRFKES